MEISAKLAAESQWKSIAGKMKVEDRGLTRLLSDFNRLGKDVDHTERLE